MPSELSRNILWVDDEIELLKSQILFLEQKGYLVETATNGDDALEMLRTGQVDLVLLDEQMPGKRGIETVGDIRKIDPHVPVVMVTKSEEEHLMDQAIGQRVDDYLVKPVNPNQVLSVCKRLLEGTKILHQHTAQDFVSRFRELEERRSELFGWKDWAETYTELIMWESRLAETGEEGLAGMLQGLKRQWRRDFSNYVIQNYMDWPHAMPGDRPMLSVDVVKESLLPVIRRHDSVIFLIVDCMRMDQWFQLIPEISDLFDIESKTYFSIVPTATPYARNAIFSGLFPAEIIEHFPDYWQVGSDDEGSLNLYERELMGEQLKRLGVKLKSQLRYEKVFTKEEGQRLVKKIPSLLQEGVTALVFNFIDILTHGRSESEILLEIAPNEQAYRDLILNWFRYSSLYGVLQEAARQGVPVVLTSDHGSVHCTRPLTVYAKRDASTNLRYKFGDNINSEKQLAFLVRDPQKAKLPNMGMNVHYIFATEDYYFVYPTKLREYQSRYYGSFLHGGISPEEMILPVAVMTPK
ncbi:MAG: bifunctional response regulator/alkaline phosphatase family protein [Gemmatimonadota bacterium]|nr:bifunctional response regulator/alkaline phosphatase family protein [Gemmatimonadota bacterium]